MPTVGAYLLNALALRAVPASLVALYIYLQTVVGAAIAWLVLDEKLHASTALGAALIFVGIALATRAARPAAVPEPGANPGSARSASSPP